MALKLLSKGARKCQKLRNIGLEYSYIKIFIQFNILIYFFSFDLTSYKQQYNI